MRKNPPSETVLAFVCIGLIGYFLFEEVILLYLSLGLGLLGLLSKKFSQLLHSAWAFVTEKLGTLMSFLLLSLIFIFILSPLAGLRRLFQKNNSFTSSLETDSNFEQRNHIYTPEDLNKPW